MLRQPVTISLYIARQFLQSFFIVYASMALIILLVDAIELGRRIGDRDIDLATILQMTLLKFPVIGQKIIPFSVMVGTVLCYVRLSRTSELIVIRASGISAWQFLIPSIITSFLGGLLVLMFINPLSTFMISRFETLENDYFSGQISSLAVSSSGLWLRQKNDATLDDPNPNESIIHALRVGEKEGELRDIIIFVYKNQDTFIRRIDAKVAMLQNEYWQLRNVFITEPNQPTKYFDEYFLETELTLTEIKNSFSPPETIPVWDLPAFIETLKSAGFSSLRHELHLQSLLALPFFFIAMVLIGALFSMRPTRHGKTGALISGSIIVAFFIYFLFDLIAALGLSGTVPIVMTSWGPVLITLFIGVALLLHMEDG